MCTTPANPKCLLGARDGLASKESPEEVCQAYNFLDPLPEVLILQVLGRLEQSMFLLSTLCFQAIARAGIHGLDDLKVHGLGSSVFCCPPGRST